MIISLTLNGRKIIKPTNRQIKKAIDGKYIKELMPSNNPILKTIPEAKGALYNLKSFIKHQKIKVADTSGADR